MAYLTRETFLKKVEASGSKYWQEGKNDRWQYMSAVIDILKEICPDDSKLIEAGDLREVRSIAGDIIQISDPFSTTIDIPANLDVSEVF